ncbi:Tn3 family transposase [Streptomyces malaysiensis subsp. malaysiensis]|uniref:Tn3 family transposase n=1 Tax=Streptomyces malaysiensis TaxID=92644 RepID=UPI0024BF2D54|nr:Tn3 family transposase [Streptomyces sp. NA07423]WHX18529.1 Tn3 family transposase [Streptomyces sp. NA07423]
MGTGLTWLKATAEAMLPRIDLPDLLFEVHSWTGFLDAFGHVSERRTRMEGLLVSLVALLVAESRDIGLASVIDPENKALTRSKYAVSGPCGDLLPVDRFTLTLTLTRSRRA